MRKRGKVDGNHRKIAEVLRNAGCTVLSLAPLGGGAPDMLVARNGRMWLFEIKDGDQPPSQRKLTDLQVKFRAAWKAPVYVITSAKTALWHIAY